MKTRTVKVTISVGNAGIKVESESGIDEQSMGFIIAEVMMSKYDGDGMAMINDIMSSGGSMDIMIDQRIN